MKCISATILLSGLLAATSVPAASTAPDYVAHEWGTFTSVQGSDGGLILWNPFVESDLPEFVYTRQRPCELSGEKQAAVNLNLLLTKSSNRWLQRMETPVIYFHATEDFTVDVSVAFPKGVLTEWYPAASAFGPFAGLPALQPDDKRSHLDWRELRVLGGSRGVSRVPPAVGSSHYFTARTDGASPLRVQRGLHPSQGGEEERFLFYRGAGNFTTPLRASIDSHGDLVLENQGAEPLGPLFVFRQRDGGAGYTSRLELAGGARHTVTVGSLPTAESAAAVELSLAQALQATLTDAGLYPEEAVAMVNTWRKDWLGDRGLRVLYLLPQTWTDAALPLALDPAPKEIVRVMVGRAEILEPAVEQHLQLALQATLADRAPTTLDQVRGLLEPRFLEPALTRVVQTEIAGQLARLDIPGDEPALVAEQKAISARVYQASQALQAQLLTAGAEPPRTIARAQKLIGEPVAKR